MGNGFRIGVDLFLMLSGALSLGRVWDIRSFLSKRIPRIVSPFLCWGFFLSIILVLISYFAGYNYISSFNLWSILNFIANAYMAVSPGFAPYWFFWMILGTYFIMPIFNKLLLHSELDEVEYFLAIWLITCLFDFTLKMDFPIKLSYFTSPIGLVVLGYYLRHAEREILNNRYFALFLTLMPLIVMMIFSYCYSCKTGVFNFNRYSFLTALEVAGVFLLFKNFSKFNIQINSKVERIIKKFISLLARYSYGIYLIHTVILSIFYRSIPYSSLDYNFVIFSFIALDIFISLVVMDLFGRIPYVNQIIGAK